MPKRQHSIHFHATLRAYDLSEVRSFVVESKSGRDTARRRADTQEAEAGARCASVAAIAFSEDEAMQLLEEISRGDRSVSRIRSGYVVVPDPPCSNSFVRDEDAVS